MTRKDYVLIADTLRGLQITLQRDLLSTIQQDPDNVKIISNERRCLLSGKIIAVEMAVLRLADRLREDNARFDTQRFIDACNP